MTRPATPTRSAGLGVRPPGRDRPARISASVWVRATSTGYGSRPSASSRSRLAWRIRYCSGSRRHRAGQVRSRRASLNELMVGPRSTQRRWPRWPPNPSTGGSRDYRRRGGAGHRAEVCAERPELFGAGAVGPVCVLRAERPGPQPRRRWPGGAANAVSSSRRTARRTWPRSCWPASSTRGPAPSPPPPSVRCASSVRSACATSILANELVDEAGLRWLAAELDAHPDFQLVCWVDSVRGVELMTAALNDAGARRPMDVCVEVGMAGGRTGCRGAGVRGRGRRAVAASPRLRLVGVAGYEAALGHDVTPTPWHAVRAYLAEVRAAVLRLAPLFETDDVMATAGGSTYFDAGRRRAHRLARRGVRADGAAQRVLHHPRRRPVPPHVAVTAGAAAGVARVGTGRLASGARAGGADDGPPRRVVRPGHAGAATGWRTAASSSSTTSTRTCGSAGDDRVGVGDWMRVRSQPPLHGLRQVADDPGARRRRPGRRPDPHVLLHRASALRR